jgi:hypothetical protein
MSLGPSVVGTSLSTRLTGSKGSSQAGRTTKTRAASDAPRHTSVGAQVAARWPLSLLWRQVVATGASGTTQDPTQSGRYQCLLLHRARLLSLHLLHSQRECCNTRSSIALCRHVDGPSRGATVTAVVIYRW